MHAHGHAYTMIYIIVQVPSLFIYICIDMSVCRPCVALSAYNFITSHARFDQRRISQMCLRTYVPSYVADPPMWWLSKM